MQINPKILISLQGHFGFVLGLLKNIKTQTPIYCGLGLISIFRKNPYVIDIYIKINMVTPGGIEPPFSA